MNPEIDLKHLSGATPSHGDTGRMVGPPRRIVSRFILPLAILGGFAALGYRSVKDSLEPVTPVQVVLPLLVGGGSESAAPAAKTAVVEAVSTVTLFQAPGWIEPEPYPTLITSLRPGTVESISVIEGQAVTSGTIIARLIDDDAELAVRSAESTLATKKVRLQAAQAQWDNPISLKESIASAEATQDKLMAESRRLKEMLDLAQVEANVGQELRKGGYEASLDTLRKTTQLSASRNQLAETEAQMRLTSATIQAARDRLRLRIEDRESLDAARAEVASAEAALATARLQLERSVIKAPHDGTIMRLYASPGSMMSPDTAQGMMLASIYQPEKMQVRVDVPLAEAAKVMPGLKAQIKVEAMADKTFNGELINIVPEFDTQKNVLPVKVRIYDPAQALRPEMIARVDFVKVTGGGVKSADGGEAPANQVASAGQMLVPEGAVNQADGKPHVLVVSPEGRLEVRPLKQATPARAGYLSVAGDLKVSDKIIADGKLPLAPGSRVKIAKVLTNESH